MNIFLPRSFRGDVKPPPGSHLNWAHPLSCGLQHCFIFNEGGGDLLIDHTGTCHADLVWPNTEDRTDSYWVPNGYFISNSSVFASRWDLKVNMDIRATDSMTMVWGGTNYGNGQMRLISKQDGAGASQHDWMLGGDNTVDRDWETLSCY